MRTAKRHAIRFEDGLPTTCPTNIGLRQCPGFPHALIDLHRKSRRPRALFGSGRHNGSRSCQSPSHDRNGARQPGGDIGPSRHGLRRRPERRPLWGKTRRALSPSPPKEPGIWRPRRMNPSASALRNSGRSPEDRRRQARSGRKAAGFGGSPSPDPPFFPEPARSPTSIFGLPSRSGRPPAASPRGARRRRPATRSSRRTAQTARPGTLHPRPESGPFARS